MRLATALTEAARTTRAERVTSGLVALLCAAVCAVSLLTVGGTAAAEAQVLGRLDAAGSRLMVVTDKAGYGLVTPAVLEVLNGLDTVDRAVGVDNPFDATNAVIGGGGVPVPAWTLAGPLDGAVTLTLGRWPRPGEALVGAAGQRTLGLTHPVGAAIDRSGREYPIVGAFVARSPFEFLDAGLAVRPESTAAAVDSVHVVVTTAGAARATERAVIGTLGPTDLSGVSVQSPTALADLQRVVSGDLGGFGRQLLLLTLGAGGFLITIVVLAEVLLRRRDLGRRRALGAPRWGLVLLVVSRTALAAGPGALAGLALGAVAAGRWGHLPPWDFIAGTGILTVVAAAVAATAPAVVAAWRDPVAVLRTP